MAKKGKKAYFGLPYIVSVILAILPPTALVCGVIQCIMEGRILPAIFRIIFGWNLVWILDIIWMVWKKQLCHFWILW